LALAFCELEPPADPVTGVLAESSPIWTPQPVSRAKISMLYDDLVMADFIIPPVADPCSFWDAAMGEFLPFFTLSRQYQHKTIKFC
jgi:hypothetical protein